MNFDEKVWQLLKKIPRGRVTTYRAIAHKLHSKGYRAVGMACHRNPYAPVAACHRVVCSDGSIGGFASGVKKKIRMLEREGVKVRKNKIVDFKKALYKF
jgi:methylated-DNA-[protein]-cysteine S-methyltransferase